MLSPARLVASLAVIVAVAAAPSAFAQSGGSIAPGGTTTAPATAPGGKAKLTKSGAAIAPAGAPIQVQMAINAGNQIRKFPYRYGGGHSSFFDSGYDCSGAVSYALYGGRFLLSPLPSGALMNWGQSGPGRWITVYAHGGHAYMVVAGLRLDTSMRDDPSRTGPGWSKRLRRDDAFQARHPRNL